MECFHRRRGKKIEQFQKQALLRLASCFKYHTVDNFRSNFYFIKTVNVTNRQIPLNFGVLDDNKNFHLKRVQTMITNPSTIDKNTVLNGGLLMLPKSAHSKLTSIKLTNLSREIRGKLLCLKN